MKRYKLKKDLPTLKAGALFQEDNEGIWACDPPQYHMRFGFPKDALRDFPDIFTDWFEEIPDEPKMVWDLKDGDECWILDVDLEPLRVEWRGTPYDLRLRELGLVYLTKEALLAEQARNEAKQILLRDTKGFRPDWRDEAQQKYIVYFDSCYGHLCTDFWCTYLSSSIYFATEEDAEASIKAHPKEWKTYLGVEE